MPDPPPNLLFSVLAFIGFLLACLPLPRHIQCATWNVGICMCMLWTALGCLMFFVHSILWDDNVENRAPVWCDISARYLVGASVGIPASSLCTIRRLYYITKLQTISVEKKKRRREIMVDVSIGIGFPCVVVTLQYIVQQCRFIIFERIGCYPCNANTLATYLLVYMWQPVISLISLVYAVLTFRRAFLQQERLRNMLHAGYQIDLSRYWRLMALCLSEIIFSFPLSFYNIIVNTIINPVQPFVSWAWTHSNISQVQQFPFVDWKSDPIVAVSLEFSRWIFVLGAFMIFAFFGLAPEARQFYYQTFWSVSRRLGYSRSTTPSSLSPTAVPMQKWRVTHASKPTLQVDGHEVERGMGTEPLSMLDRSRVKDDYSQSSPSFGAPLHRESWAPSPSLQLSGDEESVKNPPGLSTSGVTHHSRLSWETIPMAPVPGDSEISSQDIGRAI